MQQPLIVIGAGPIGLAAAAQARARSLGVMVLEAGPFAGAAVRDWGHVRLFSPWSQLIDPTAALLLASKGWRQPDADAYPTGEEWATSYLQPLADALGDAVRYEHRVTGVAKQGRDLLVDSGRDEAGYAVHVDTPIGERRLEGSAVVDASGTWTTANPLGGNGLPAVGEKQNADRITYRVPDLRDPGVAARFAGRHVAVAGTGASALTVLIELVALAEQQPGTRISWLVRRSTPGNAFGGGDADQLAARGALGQHAAEAAASRFVSTVTGFRTTAVSGDGQQLRLESADGRSIAAVDEVVAVTGFRPDLSFLPEVRLDLDPVLQSPRALAPLIDPNVHSCGTVYPHGAAELAQPDTGYYAVGMKSYGRAPSFLAMTGFEQARSVVAAVAGDAEAAARVELTLPETGVCGGTGLFDESVTAGGGGCCGEPERGEPLSVGARAEH